MGCWTLKPVGLSVLFGLLFIFVLILVLPQVDLLDTAFHRDTTPSAVHSRGIPPLEPNSIAPAALLCRPTMTGEPCLSPGEIFTHPVPESVLILNSVLRV